MPARVYLSEALLQPATAERPAGRDLRFEPVFGEILEARRADEASGKAPDWEVVADRSLGALQISKDLRLCCFLTEAGIFLDGFAGLRDCLRLTREILTRFWEQGLFPLIEDGDLDYRSGPLAWFNERMADAIKLIPVTSRGDKGENYSFSRFLQAQQIGTEDGISRLPGERRETVMGLRQQGWITIDTFAAAVKATPRRAFEAICQPFEEARQQFLALERTVEEKFGSAAPSFRDALTTLDDMQMLLEDALNKKREEEPGPLMDEQRADEGAAKPTRTKFNLWMSDLPPESRPWKQAEELIQSGQIDQGLQQMAALAARETSGRARFLRKLTLADVCRDTGRERLARTILEELNRQITEYKLEHWESTALVGSVWSRLYRLYKKSEMSSEQDQAVDLYNQLSPFGSLADVRRLRGLIPRCHPRLRDTLSLLCLTA